MARTVTDLLGLAGTELKLNSSDEGKTINTATSKNKRGDIINRETYGALTNPSEKYALAADYAVASLSLGTLIDGGTDPDYVITGIDISTAGATPPSIDVSAESVPTASVQGVTYTTPTFSLLKDHEAQILFAAFVLTGDDCDLQSCKASLKCNLTRAYDADADTCAFDVSGAEIQVSATITQSGLTAPTVTPASDWTITSPLTRSDKNDDFQSWTVALTYTPATVEPV